MDEPTVTPGERRVDPTAADEATLVDLGLIEPAPPDADSAPAA